MTLQAQASISRQTDSQQTNRQEPEVFISNEADINNQEQQYRASAYALFAALLRTSPDQNMLDRVAGLTQETQREGDNLLITMSALGLSARILTPTAIEDEYQDLFIGLGKGEVVPYGSWYLTGFLMEKPLSDLRDDLDRLGYERSEETSEPEDHAAALFEVISLMISDGASISAQKNFFQSHMANWLGRFFSDLTEAKSAIFYKAVGRFGLAFIAFENEYFSMQT